MSLLGEGRVWLKVRVKNRTFSSSLHIHDGQCVTHFPILPALLMPSLEMISPNRLNTEVEIPIVPCIPIINCKRDIHVFPPSPEISRISFVSYGSLTRTKLILSFPPNFQHVRNEIIVVIEMQKCRGNFRFSSVGYVHV